MAKFFLTDHAQYDLEEIELYSLEHWGQKQTSKYLKELYKHFQKLADYPQKGALRQHRSSPFLMAPIEKHYAIYTTIKQGIIIVAILHSKRNIEAIISKITAMLMEEISVIQETEH